LEGNIFIVETLKSTSMTGKKCYLFFFFFCLFSTNSLLAQQTSTGNSGGFKLFFEKVYLHLDRGYYASGDNIWFKAYLVNAQTNFNINTSNNLYVELIAPDAHLVSRHVIRLDNGYGKGDFKLADSIPAGTYRIRAYTNWMKNFNDYFVFEKDIQVQNILEGNNVKGSIKTVAKTASVRGITSYKTQFLPEGGVLVEGINNRVAFKTEDANGNGVEAQGVILSSKGDTTIKFKTIHLGMGSFMFKPETGLTYTAIIKYRNDQNNKEELPAAYPDGFVMKVTEADSNFLVSITANALTMSRHSDGQMTIGGRHANKLYYKQSVVLKNGEASVLVPKNNFPPGITSLTLYDEKLHPQCERLVFTSEDETVNIAVSTDSADYHSKGKVVLTLTATDDQKKPVKSNLSLSVVDEGIAPFCGGNIVSYLSLESELNGKIENATDYFDKSNSHRFEQLDLLLLTQGWRSFLWQRIADTAIHISFMPEPGIAISGRVKALFGNKPLSNMNITLVAGGARGAKLYATQSDSTGRYYLDGLPLYGDQKIKLSSKNDKGKKGGMIYMDTLFSNMYRIYAKQTYNFDTSSALKHFTEEAAKRWTNNKKENVSTNTLPDVIVSTNQPKVVVSRDGTAYMSFGYPVYNMVPSAQDFKDYGTLANFLIHKIPGAVADVEGEGVNFIANGKKVRPGFIVDNKEDMFERMDYYQVNLDQITNVTVTHMVGGADSNGNMTLGDRFDIHLSLKAGAYNVDMALIITDVPGYYEARTFYAPTYLLTRERLKPDLRTTIFWEPEIVTDENGQATVTYYNADPKTKIRVSVEGLSVKGVPVAATTHYEVK
jgi:hypothetical protein